MKNINVLCATDRNFLYPTYVTMISVIKNHPQMHVRFFLIVDKDLSADDLNKLKEFIESRNATIEFLRIDIDDFDGFEISERFTKAAYFRLMAHKYLPKSLDRILYLDVDIVVNADISEFYFEEFGDKDLLATSHNPVPDYYNTLDSTTVNLEAAGKGEFFNSGVLVFNLRKFRENITADDYVSAYEKCLNNDIKVFYDQGLLNYMFFDKTRYFSSMDYNYRYSIRIDYKRRIDQDKRYKKAIIHYTGMKQPYKPWDIIFNEEEIQLFGNVPYDNNYFYVSESLNDLMKIWWEYAKYTPVYDELLQQEQVKHKWFSRNLMPLLMRLNSIQQHNNVKICYKDKPRKQIVEVYPKDFKHRAYKLGCVILSPFYFVRKVFRNLKKKKSR